MNFLGFQVTKIEEGYVEGDIVMRDELKQQSGFLHGGVTSTLCDLVMGFAAYTLVPEGEGTVTSNLNVMYYRPGKGIKFLAKGRVQKPGKLLYYCSAEIIAIDESGNETLIAESTSAMCSVRH